MSIVQDIIQGYDHIFKSKNDCPFEVIVTDNIYSDRFELCNTKNDQMDVKGAEPELQNSNELLVLPDEQNSMFLLLIRQDHFNESGVYSQTIAYEYTHAIDYFECKTKYNILNLRKDSFPDHDCFQFVSEVRASFRGPTLFYHLTNADKDALVFAYISKLVPAYEKILTGDLSENMYDLAQFYGQYLAIRCYINAPLSLPGYITHSFAGDLLLQLNKNIGDTNIFDNYESLSVAYSDFINKKTQGTPNPLLAMVHDHSHCGCNHS
ncbi:hypothetical protein [Acetobacterium tundrae]|uniref:Uncharacterized protein n=1 Tax=Acetobacterium tundrae TaxID=132932 RepID=A0ABR6WIM4_9FIRM|nr:hypothetical protein [Acetobacterium tundrae]MBC3796138.1 hypothetical protein [Acetobacterium tundrae]